MTTAIEPWLKSHLIASGRLTETGLGRCAQVRRCQDCRAAEIVGLDDDRCAGEFHADPRPLSPAGELVALLSGRRTVNLAMTSGRPTLWARGVDQIKAHPAGEHQREDTLAEHTCGRPVPAEWSRPSNLARPRPVLVTSEPPF